MGMIQYYFRADEPLLRRIAGEGAELLYDKEYAERLLDVDKSWHIIHYTLNRTVWEVPSDSALGPLVLGGEIFIEEDMGYGPPRLLDAETVRRLAQALVPWDRERFRAAFSLPDLIAEKIYPVLPDEDGETCLEYAWEYLEMLRAFLRKAAAAGDSVLTFVS